LALSVVVVNVLVLIVDIFIILDEIKLLKIKLIVSTPYIEGP